MLNGMGKKTVVLVDSPGSIGLPPGIYLLSVLTLFLCGKDSNTAIKGDEDPVKDVLLYYVEYTV